MKKVDKETIIKIVISIALSAFFYYLLCSKKLSEFINPNINILVKFTVLFFITLALILIFQMKNLFNVKKKNRSYILYIIPMIAAFVVFNMQGEKKYSLEDTNNIKGIILHDSKEVTLDKEHNNNYNLNNEKIQITDENYIYFLDCIYNDFDKIKDKTIVINGFLYKDKSLKDNEFALVRILMSCCSADTKTLGIICKANEKALYNNYTWLSIEGNLEKVENGEIILKANKITKIVKPEKFFLYLH